MISLTLSKATQASEIEWAKQIFDDLTDEVLLFWAPIISKVSPEEYTAFIGAVQQDKAELVAIKRVLEEERKYTQELKLNYEKLEQKYRLSLMENTELRAQAQTYEALYEHVKPTFVDKIATKAGVGAAVFALLWTLTQ
ncbi:MAG: hypothetical protein QM401_04210 [Bacillota bacterium]|nr:hypothetical protein [Bacillota bacterium]